MFCHYIEICKDKSIKEKHKIANKTSFYILFICLLILFFGQNIFSVLGITLIAFQIGSGIILLLSGISMMQENDINMRIINFEGDPSLIPLTLPITVGPGTVGSLFVWGNDFKFNKLNDIYILIGIFISVLIIWFLLYFSYFFDELLGKKGLKVLSKLTGLFLSILAIQSILNGTTSFIKIF